MLSEIRRVLAVIELIRVGILERIVCGEASEAVEILILILPNSAFYLFQGYLFLSLLDKSYIASYNKLYS
jgi:hypothetical protein